MNELMFYDLKSSAGLTPSLCSQVVKEMGRRIVSGRYPTGSLVDDETTLSDRYQVSRTVIRDAVKVLVGKGLLDVRRGIGTRVRERKDWQLLDDDVLAWQLSAPPDKSTLLQLMEIRQVFEPQAARWAAMRALPGQVEDIRIASEEMRASICDSDKFVVADARFHRSVLRAANNEFLSAMEGVIFSTLLSSIRLTNQDQHGSEESLPLHDEVYAAIVCNDEVKAENTMKFLLQDANRKMKQLLYVD